MQQQIYKLLSSFFTFDINWSYHWSKIIACKWVIGDKFGVIGLLHFHEGVLPSHVAEKPQYIYAQKDKHLA